MDSIERSPTLSSAERSTSSFSFRDSVSPFHFAFPFSSVFSTAFNRGTMDRGDSSFLGSPLSLVSSGRELYRECLQGLSSHPSQRFVLTYALVPLSPCSYPTLARTRDARGGRKIVLGYRRLINNSFQREKGRKDSRAVFFLLFSSSSSRILLIRAGGEILFVSRNNNKGESFKGILINGDALRA